LQGLHTAVEKSDECVLIWKRSIATNAVPSYGKDRRFESDRFYQKINISMTYTIIEDCSPYYIRFTHAGLDNVIDYCKAHMPQIGGTFVHYRFPKEHADHLLSLLPMAKQMPLRPHRVSLFMTKAGGYYRAHKDGIVDRFSINYTVQILDEECVTSWYSDEDLKDYPIDNLSSNSSRECIGFNKTNHTPIKTMTAKAGECILFNTEIFHDFDNQNSTNLRVVLTLRIMENIQRDTYFEDAKEIIFGNKTI